MQHSIAQSRMLYLALPMSLMLVTGGLMAQPESGAPPIAPPGQFDRIVASSASLELLEVHRTEEGLISEPVELMRTTFRQVSSRGNQLTIGFDGECSAWLNGAGGEGDVDLDIGLLDEDGEILAASVAVWVEVNGEAVPVAPNDMAPDDGSMIYCHAGGEADLEADDLIALHARSRSTSGFSWVANDAGQGDYEVSVMARIEVAVDEDDDNDEPDPAEIQLPLQEEDEATNLVAAAIFGKRTLTVEPGNIRIVDVTPANEG